MGSEQLDFSVPPGWTLDRSANAPTLVAPEGDLWIAFVEAKPGASIQETALAAWRVIDPEFASKVRIEAAVPPQGAWDETHQVVYETPANEARIELALVRRLGAHTFVNLVRGSNAAVSRRGAQLMEAMTSWKPPGYRQANLQDAAASPWTDQLSRELKEFLLSAMTAMQIPGVSVAVVQGGRVVYAEGLGIRNLDDNAPVTPRTRFMIGSTTKPLTTLLMARLIDQKKLNWSTPICDILPGFALADPELTRRLELRHTASASTGMPRQDMEFIFRYSGIRPEDRIAQMRTMRPTTGFGETFQYSNFLVAAGGYAATRAFDSDSPLENAFDSALTELVFRPLGMKDSFVRQEDALGGEAASPHAPNFDGGVSRIPLSIEMSVYSVAPAGGAWSTGPDLCRYLLLELGKGRMPEGERIISEDILLERRQKGVKIDENSYYGLGLFVSDESGLQVIHHGGNTLGFSSDLFFVPGKDLGVVVLTNVQQANVFLGAVRQKVFELAFGAEPKAEKTIATGVKLRQDVLALLQEKITTDPASLAWIDEFLGTYHCPELGSAQLTKSEDGFWMQFDEWGSAVGSEIQPGGDRLLRLISPPWRGGFRLLADAASRTLSLDAGQSKYVFHKQD